MGERINKTEWKRRAAILRRYEDFCYQICYFLLQCEAKAWQAAKSSIERLFHDDRFYRLQDVEQREHIRRTAMHCALNAF